MKHREYICVTDGSSPTDTRSQKPFILHVQKAILLSLEERKLISKQQRRQCEEALENRAFHI